MLKQAPHGFHVRKRVKLDRFATSAQCRLILHVHGDRAVQSVFEPMILLKRWSPRVATPRAARVPDSLISIFRTLIRLKNTLFFFAGNPTRCAQSTGRSAR